MGFDSLPPPGSKYGALSEIGIVLLAIAAGFVFAYCAGCSPSQIQAQTTAMQVTAAVYDGAASVAESAYRAELNACPDTACVDAAEERWAPVGIAEASLLALLTAWHSALVLIRDVGDLPALWSALQTVIAPLAERWNAIGAALHVVGRDWPALPGGAQ